MPNNSVNSILHDGNLDLYPVFPGPLYSFNIDIEFYKVLLNEVVESSKYDYVIVDSRGFSDFINSFFCDHITGHRGGKKGV